MNLQVLQIGSRPGLWAVGGWGGKSCRNLISELGWLGRAWGGLGLVRLELRKAGGANAQLGFVAASRIEGLWVADLADLATLDGVELTLFTRRGFFGRYKGNASRGRNYGVLRKVN